MNTYNCLFNTIVAIYVTLVWKFMFSLLQHRFHVYLYSTTLKMHINPHPSKTPQNLPS